MPDQTGLIQLLNTELDIVLPEKISPEELKEKLSQYINELIRTNFQKLITLLYRIDISEPRLKHLLKENQGENAGKIIAELIIERQLQKIKSRNENKRNDIISDDEIW